MTPGVGADSLAADPDRFAGELPGEGTGTWWVGFSGGMDSSVLLALLARHCTQPGTPALRALHINHQLSREAGSWRSHCEAVCADAGIPLEVREVTVDLAGSGPEAAARSARYAAFEQVLQPGDTLFLAHHLDDQVETFFLRLLRGAGARGLSAMPRSRRLGAGRLWRPLLHVPRYELRDCALELGLGWIEDDSNSDTGIDRNYLRREVLPHIEARWPSYRGAVIHARDAIAEGESLLDQHYGPLLDESVGEHFGEPTLALAPLVREGVEGACRLLRAWLQRWQRVPPARSSLREFVRQLLDADDPSGASLAARDYTLRCYAGAVYLSRQFALTPACDDTLIPGQALVLHDSRLHAVSNPGHGLREPASGHWRVGFRRGGERAHPSGRGHSRSLKKLLQEYRVPPWWRDRLPLLYDGDELVAVADLWVCQGHVAGAGEAGWSIDWKPNSPALAD